MNKLQQSIFIFYALLNVSVTFGMQPATFYEKEDNKQDSFVSLDIAKNTTFIDTTKHGSCWIQMREDKWFVQPVNISNSAMIGSRIEIVPPARDVKAKLTNSDFFNRLVVGINEKNYLFTANTMPPRKLVIPYRDIKHNAFFYEKTSDEYRLINTDGTLTLDSDAPEADACPEKIGIIRDLIGGKVLIDVYKEKQHIETISLVMPLVYYKNVLKKQDSNIVLSYDSDDSEDISNKNILTIQKDVKSNSDSEQTSSEPAKVLQIKYEPNKKASEHRPPYPIYTATALQYQKDSQNTERIKVQFNIADTTFFRFISASYGFWNYKYYLDISDIIPNTSVCFIDLNNNKSKRPKTNEEEYSAELTTDSIKSKIAHMNKSCYGIIAYANSQKESTFLPTYEGTLFYEENKWFLQLEGIQEPIMLAIMNHDDDQLEKNCKKYDNVSLILQENGNDLCFISCNFKKQEKEIRVKTWRGGLVQNTSPESPKPTNLNFSNKLKTLKRFCSQHKFPLLLALGGSALVLLFWYMRESNAENVTIA